MDQDDDGGQDSNPAAPAAGRWTLPPLGVVLVGGLSLGWGLMLSYFVVGMGGGLEGVLESRLSTSFKALTLLIAVLLGAQVLVGICLVLGLRRRALTLAPVLFFAGVLAEIARELASPLPQLAESMPLLIVPTVLGVLAALVAYQAQRGARSGESRPPWWRLCLLCCEVVGAGFVVAQGALLWLNVIASHDAEAPVDRVSAPVASRTDIPADALTSPLPSTDGLSLPVSAADGRRGTLVVFWATWCRPCVAELPALAAVGAQLAEDDVRVVLINVDLSEASRVHAFLAARGASPERTGLVALLDPDQRVFKSVGGALGQNSLPTTLVLDASGRPVGHWIGARDERQIIRETLQALRQAEAPADAGPSTPSGR